MALSIFLQGLREKAAGTMILAILLFLLLAIIGNMSTAPGNAGPAMEGSSGLQMFFSIMGLVIGGYLAFMTASFIAGEIENKTCDLLFTLPVTRADIVISRSAVIVPIVAIIGTAMMMGVYIGSRSVQYSFDMIWIGYTVMFISVFGLAAGMLSMLISTLTSNSRISSLLSIGILFAMYLMEMIGSTISRLSWIKPFSLFHYLEIKNIMGAHVVNWTNLGILAAAAILFLVLAVFVFRRRDITVS